MKRLKQSIRSAINSLGYDLTRYSGVNSPQMRLMRSLVRFEIDCILDVGANEGQFASDLLSLGFPGKVISFEPLSSAHALICEKARNVPNWRVHPRTAIGDLDGELTINIAGNSVSSSLLPMTLAHSGAETKSSYTGTERTPVWRADTVMPQYLDDSTNALLKIDTQGYEWQVLDGAAEVLRRVRGVCCEMSLVSLYEGQHLWKDLLARLEGEGFTLWTIEGGFTDPRDGRSLQFDASFFKT